MLKRHLPYHESDHVLNIAFNILAGGRRLEHIELRRNDEVFLNALGPSAFPTPPPKGTSAAVSPQKLDVQTLMDAINETRLRVWAQQPDEFFEEAFVDADGTMVPTDAECKQGVDIDHNGDWGYQAGLISLANTAEPLYLVNRSGNRPSHEQMDVYLDKAIALCRRAGFRRITLRGDTDFSQTKHLDRWDQPGDICFIFGIDARENLKALARSLPAQAYSVLVRPPKYAIKTEPRQRPERVKEEIVRQRKYETIRLLEEDGRRVRVSPGGLPEELTAWSCSASAWVSTRGRCGCARRFATSFISPTTARPQPTKSSSKPTIVATKRI